MIFINGMIYLMQRKYTKNKSLKAASILIATGSDVTPLKGVKINVKVKSSHNRSVEKNAHIFASVRCFLKILSIDNQNMTC